MNHSFNVWLPTEMQGGCFLLGVVVTLLVCTLLASCGGSK